MLYWDTALVGTGGGGAAATHQAGCDVLKAFVFNQLQQMQHVLFRSGAAHGLCFTLYLNESKG